MLFSLSIKLFKNKYSPIPIWFVFELQKMLVAKLKMQDTFLSQKWSVQAEVLL